MNIFVGFVLISLSICNVQNPDGSVSGDRSALMALYEATSGAGWYNNGGWGDGNPDNSWHGVEVNADGRVVRLDLQDNGLSGQLPASIGDLTALEYLNVKQNALQGTIPSSVGNLSQLRYLLLSGVAEEPPTNPQYNIHQGKSDNSGNTFTGTIPVEIGNLSQLEYIELSGSEVSGTIPDEIGNATNLKFIAFSWNKNLTGGIPSTIGNLQNLIWFYARSSNLDGTLPAELGSVTSLRTFHVGVNDEWGGEGLHGELPDLSRLTMLRNLTLDHNNFSGPWPDYWNNGSFDNFISLRASWNNFSIDQLHGFENLTSLMAFSLTGNTISGTLPQSITALRNAKIIGLGWTGISGELPQSGWEFHQLRLVYLNNNNLTGHIPGSFFEAADNPYLKWLYLQNNEFTSIDREAMNNVSSPKLQTIDVSGNNF